MIRVLRNHPEHNSFYLQYPVAIGIRDYTYFMSYQELEEAPFVNEQPNFDLQTQELLIENFEEEGVFKRRWVVVDRVIITEE